MVFLKNYFFYFYCIFRCHLFPYTLFHLHPHPSLQQSPHCCLCPSALFLFAQSHHPSNPHPHSCQSALKNVCGSLVTGLTWHLPMLSESRGSVRGSACTQECPHMLCPVWSHRPVVMCPGLGQPGTGPYSRSPQHAHGLVRMSSFALPSLIIFRVCLYPSMHFPLFLKS